jgi:hypothetical protein
MNRIALVATAAATLLIGAPATLAQPLTREELESALAQRDQEIAALEKRLAALEAKEAAQAAAPTVVRTVAEPNAPATTASATASQGATPSEDDVALQALSRGLVQRGLLLLPLWSVEAAPSVAYSHSQIQGLALVDTPEGITTVDSQRRRDDDVQGSLAVRAGLPWRSQVQITVPFDWRREASALGDGTEVSHSATHLGDLQLEFSHQFLVESGWAPDIIGAVTWRIPTGLDPYKAPIAAVANGVGTNGIIGRLTVLKTIDPLVVYSTLSYTANLPYRESFGRVHAGDAIDSQVGALLAVSPDTSLSFAFDQRFAFVTRVDGAKIPGSDGVAAVAQFGIDQVLSSRTLLEVTLGIGLTRDAPDYSLMVSVPIRFR